MALLMNPADVEPHSGRQWLAWPSGAPVAAVPVASSLTEPASGKIDVMYPLGTGSAWGNNELRYSLRSLQKYAANLGRVFVVGEKPPWLTGVVHIPMADRKGFNKDANIINKVRAAIKAGISKRFIRASDDQFLCAPVDLATLPVTRAKGDTSGDKGKHRKWWARVQHTYDWLTAKGFPAVFYDTHLFQPHDAELFEAAVASVPYEKKPGFTVNTLTLNQYPGIISQSAGNVRGKIMKGYNDEALKDPEGLKKTLAAEFPEPSRFELDEVSAAMVSAISQGSCSESHYRAVLSEIEKRRPCNVLVFGCGHDSTLWRLANAGGRTLFVEDVGRWAEQARQSGCEVVTIHYGSNRDTDLPDEPPPEAMRDVLEQSWDVVFIDGPKGYGRKTPGRQLPIRWVSRLPGSPVVFLHDYNRPHESRHANRYLGPPTSVVDQQLAAWSHGTQAPPAEHAWTYWDGARPAWIELCFESMRRNIPGIQILTPTSFAKLYAEHRGPDEPYDLLSTMPALSMACQRSNVIRAWLLKTLGGMWVDADCIVLSDLRDLCRKYMGDGKDLVTYKYKKRFSVDALLMSAPNGQVISELARLQQEVLRASKGSDRIDRMVLGPPLLSRAIAAVGVDKVGIIPTGLVDPARGGRDHEYLAKGELPEGCGCVMLRAGTGSGKLHWTKEQWLDSSCFLSRVFRRALGV